MREQMKIVKQFLSVLVVFVLLLVGIGMAATPARATSPFTCGQTSLPGSISCETGEDYIRWTFSGISAASTDFGYDYVASQAGWAELHTDIQYTKKMGTAAGAANYLIVRYVDYRADATQDFATRQLHSSPGPGAGVRSDGAYDVAWGASYTKEDKTIRLMEGFEPGAGKKLQIVRVGAAAEDRMDGVIELRQVSQGQSALASTSPFYCGTQTNGRGYRSSALEASGGDSMGWYWSLNEGITCEEGPNYIKWTYEKVSPFFSRSFANIPELSGQAVTIKTTYHRKGWCGGQFDAPWRRTANFSAPGVWEPTWTWDKNLPDYTWTKEYNSTLSGTDQGWGYSTDMGDHMSFCSMDAVSGEVLITAPNYVNTAATATSQAAVEQTQTAQADLTLTAEADLTATAGYDLTQTAVYDLTATALAITPSPTSSTGDPDPGPGPGPNPPNLPDPPNPNPTVTPVPTWTATSTRTPTPTATATATGTPTRTATPGPSPTVTPTPRNNIPTNTPGSSIPTNTPVSGTDATLTAIVEVIKTLTAIPPGPGGNSTATPSIPLGTQGGTPAVSVPLGGGSGTGTSPLGSSAAASTPSGVNSVVYSGPCSAYLRVLAYVDTNNDNIMALQGEGVSGVGVSLADADYNIVSELGMENGVVKFCVPDRLAGQMVYVDIPYLLRSGSLQVPRPQRQQQNNNPFGNSETASVSLPTLELFFKLDAPLLPLALP